MTTDVPSSEGCELSGLRYFDQRTLFYGQREFHYDHEQDTYTCTHGALLRLEKHRYTERRAPFFLAPFCSFLGLSKPLLG